MHIEEVITAPHSPWQNAYMERVIGSIRRECLDHVIALSEEHLRRILKEDSAITTIPGHIDHSIRTLPFPDPSNQEREARSPQYPRSAAFTICISGQLDVVGVELVPSTD